MQSETGKVRLKSDSHDYERHAEELTRFATSLVGPSDASDVVHDAVLSLLSSGELARADNPRALMYRAVLAKATTLHRSVFRRRRRERSFAETIMSVDPDPRPDVTASLVKLSSQQRACVWLTYWEDLDSLQVGERLGIAEGTVKSHLARARETLRKVLDE
jgi:RNA polymerase sigma-70 factor (ECF subfamily)